MTDLLLTPAQVAERCQLSTRTVVRAIGAGELRAVQLASRGCWRIDPVDVDEWLEAKANRPRAVERFTPAPVDLAAIPTGRGRGRRSDGVLTVRPGMGREEAA